MSSVGSADGALETAGAGACEGALETEGGEGADDQQADRGEDLIRDAPWTARGSRAPELAGSPRAGAERDPGCGVDEAGRRRPPSSLRAARWLRSWHGWP